jgi:endonuclease-3 related protein
VLNVDELLDRLASAYGPQRWWPAESSFEVMVGAVLVQRTAWRNAELALARLRQDHLLDARALARTNLTTLAELVRPAGFYRTKAAYLRGMAERVVASGGIEGMQRWSDDELRRSLLDLRGVGEETANAIQLYAFGRPAWVADAYSRRIFARLWGSDWDASSERSFVHPLVAERAVARLNELHALIVEHAKRCCRIRPRCEDCVLRRRCSYGLSQIRSDRGAS